MTQQQIIGLIAAATAGVVCITSLILSAVIPHAPAWMETVTMISLGALLNSFSPSVLPGPNPKS